MWKPHQVQTRVVVWTLALILCLVFLFVAVFANAAAGTFGAWALLGSVGLCILQTVIGDAGNVDPPPAAELETGGEPRTVHGGGDPAPQASSARKARVLAMMCCVLALLSLADAFALLVWAGATPSPADPVCAALLCLAMTGVVISFACLVLSGKLQPQQTPCLCCKTSKGSTCCNACCLCCGFPIFLFFVILATWQSMMSAHTYNEIMPPGTMHLVETTRIHVYCTGPRDSNLTVLFFHGLAGGVMDVEWVRRTPQVAAADVQLCAVDRPGAGWSEQIPPPQHFGHSARLVRAALEKQQVQGDLILMYHSLGAFFSLQLAFQLRDATNLVVKGALSIEAVDPEWWMNEPIPPEDCDKNGPLNSFDFFWRTMLATQPFGVPRFGLELNVFRYKEYVHMYPPDVFETVWNNGLKMSFFDGIITDLRNYGRSCGFALEGLAEFSKLKSFEIIVTAGTEATSPYPGTDGYNNSRIARVSNQSRVVRLPTVTHPEVMLRREVAQTVVADALMRVIDEVRSA